MSENKRYDKHGQGTEKQFEEQVIAIDRIARVVKGGRRFRFRVLVAIGDKKTRVGVGVSKATDIQKAIKKAVEVAKKNLITVPLYKSTIPHYVEVKNGGAHVMLKPAADGTGVIAGGVIRSVLDVTGIKDVLSKSLGSSNKINTAYATIEALSQLKPASEWVVKPKPAQSSKAKTENRPAKQATSKASKTAKTSTKSKITKTSKKTAAKSKPKAAVSSKPKAKKAGSKK